MRKGVVVNIESTVESIKRAVEEAERISGCEIRSVYVGIAGGHIRGQNSLGIVAVKGREVDEDDVERAIDAAKAIAIPLDRQILHTLPQFYVVDEQDGIRDPVGMSGVRLEAKVHIVTGAVTSIQNIVKSVNRVGLDINDIVLEQIASSEAVLSNDEKDLGRRPDRHRRRHDRHRDLLGGEHQAHGGPAGRRAITSRATSPRGSERPSPRRKRSRSATAAPSCR